MTIAWTYLDKRAASIDALKDFAIMTRIIDSYPLEMEDARSDMAAYRASVLSLLPKAKSPHGGEMRLASSIDAIDILRERYRQALEFREWFEPAWDSLSEDDRFILTEFYRDDDGRQQDVVGGICEYFHIERTAAYNKKNRALMRLAHFLYGK